MVTVSESLKKGVESFLEVTPQVTSHMENRENPHGVTRSHVGLGNVLNEEQATKAEFNLHKENCENPHSVTKEQVGLGNLKNEEQATKAEFLAEKEKGDLHFANLENPHAVTKEQVGLSNLKNVEQATKEELSAHLSDKENPHFITKEQVGLGSVKNAEQATVRQYIEHVGGIADKHSGADIMYSDTKSVNEKIDELIVEGGSGTMYHNELLNRDAASQHPISAIDGLEEKMQELDTVKENVDLISEKMEKDDGVIVCEIITTTGTETKLTLQGNSQYIKDGNFVLPGSTAAVVEIKALAVAGVDGMAMASMCAVTKGSCMMYYSDLFTSNFDDFNYKWLPAAPGDGDPKYAISLISDYNNGLSIKVTGVDGVRVHWKVLLEVKNMVKVEAEA